MRVLMAGLLATSVLALEACRTVEIATPFEPAAAAFVNAKGRATISGQAFLRRNDGVVVYAAGADVALVPVTPYTIERAEKIFQGGKLSPPPHLMPKIEGEDPNYKLYRRLAKANGEGRFVFNEVGPGQYFIVAPVVWCAPSQYGCIPQGGQVMERITIAGAEKADLVLSGH